MVVYDADEKSAWIDKKQLCALTINFLTRYAITLETSGTKLVGRRQVL